MISSICSGLVRHRRHFPVGHSFQYRQFMMLADLDELPQIADASRWWSIGQTNLASFRRSDYFPESAGTESTGDLKAKVQQRVADHLGYRPLGRVLLLAHWRYFGYCFNPVVFFYVYHETRLVAIVAEVTNTPWKDRHVYVLDISESTPSDGGWTFEFDKQMHVSPFMEMGLEYQWRFNDPLSENAPVRVHMNVLRNETKLFDATLNLDREPVNGRALGRVLWHHPATTFKVMAAIHWQAARLWWKGIMVHDHPTTSKPRQSPSDQFPGSNH